MGTSESGLTLRLPGPATGPAIAREIHRVLQGGGAQRGAEFLLKFLVVLWTLFSCSEMSLIDLIPCTPMKGTP